MKKRIMATSVRAEVDCLARLFDIGAYLDDVIDFFILEGIMKKEEIPYLRNHPDQAKYVQTLIAKARASNLLLMADFEWQILPYERIKLYFVTSRVAKTIEYSNA